MIDLVSSLENGLIELNKNDSWDKSKIHASDLSIILPEEDRKCARSIWLRTNEAKAKKSTVGEMMMFENGHSIHRRTVEYLRMGLPEGWLVKEVELGIGDRLPGNLTGTLDLLLEGPDDIKVIVDFKTRRGRAFNYLDNPSPRDVLQVQTYLSTDSSVNYGLLLYIDREGQNRPIQFLVERDDERVLLASKEVEKVFSSKEPPRRMLPVIKIGKNKGPDSVKLELPWQCDYCSYLDVSCPGALQARHRGQIVGYVDENGKLEMKEKYSNLESAVAKLLPKS